MAVTPPGYPTHCARDPYHQPQVNLRTGTVIGAEALIRWQHPDLGLLPPAEFLPVIEDHPLAVDLGDWSNMRASPSGHLTSRQP